MDPMIVVFAMIAFLAGSLSYIFVLTSKRRTAERDLRSERERSAALESLTKRIPELEVERQRLNDKIQVLGEDRSRLSGMADRIPFLEKTLEGAQRRNEELRAAKESLEAELKAEHSNFERLKDAREELSNQFEAISKRVLTTNSDSFLTLAQQSLGKYQEAAKGDLEKRQQAIQELVTPLQTKIRDFEQKVDEVYRTEAAERNSLRGEIKNLVELNQQISKEASNLAMALKGDTKKQGNWGELILEKVLEFSGLRKGEEYKLQVSQQDEDGKRQQPDAIIYLPENKHIIVDAKVSLVAYDRFVSAQSEEERSLALLEHIASVKNHIKLLSDKKYQSLPELDSPDFTLLYADRIILWLGHSGR